MDIDERLLKIINDNLSYRESQIHHYTSLDGLISILKNNTIRFTECCYMNDKEEYNDILRIIDKMIDKPNYLDLDEKEILAKAYKASNDMYGKYVPFDVHRNGRIDFTPSRFFIFSTTLIKDSLPMWHYYSKGKNNDGCVLSLYYNKLKKAISGIKDTKVLLGKVIYDDDKKMQMIEEALSIVYADYCNLIDGLDKSDADFRDQIELCRVSASQELCCFIQGIRLFFKPKAFEYEKEYRILLMVREDFNVLNDMSDDSSSNLKMFFIPYEGLIRSHIDLTFGKSSIITNIMFSPVADFQLCKRCVQDLLDFYGYVETKKEIKYEKSNCSIRF